MAGRPFMLATLLGASIGVPYYLSHSTQSAESGRTAADRPEFVLADVWNGRPIRRFRRRHWRHSCPLHRYSSVPLTYPTTATPAALTGLENLQPGQSVRYHRIRDVFRFDISKEWIYQNWDRKSTGLGDPELFGIRVVLVTGTQRADLAGSLTLHVRRHGTSATHLFPRPDGRHHAARAVFDAALQIPANGRPARRTVVSGPQWHERVQRTADATRVGAGGRRHRTAASAWCSSSVGRGRTAPSNRLCRTWTFRKSPRKLRRRQPNRADGATGEATHEPALVGKLRPATQAEHNQVFDRRWPN